MYTNKGKAVERYKLYISIISDSASGKEIFI